MYVGTGHFKFLKYMYRYAHIIYDAHQGINKPSIATPFQCFMHVCVYVCMHAHQGIKPSIGCIKRSLKSCFGCHDPLMYSSRDVM